MTEHGICAKCKKSVGCPYADDRITGCKNFVLEPELKLTSKEWLRQCNTEQLAEFIIKVMLFYDNGGITMLEAIKKAVEDNEKLGSYFMESVLEWLKQPHTEKE